MATSDLLNKLKTDLTDSYNNLDRDSLVSVEHKNTDSLPNAISNVIDTYKSYIPTGTDTDGVCENAVALNGKVTIEGNSKQGELPDEYQQVEYIESVGYQYINTNYKPTRNTNILFKTNINSSLFLFGVDSKWMHNGYGVTVNYYEFGNQSSDISLPTGSIKTIKLQNGILYADDEIVSDLSSVESFNSDYSLYLFALNRSGEVREYGNLKLYSAKIIENSTLIRDYIPCYRKSDNVAGLYDLVNDEFYTNQGEGDFALGNNVPNPDYPQDIEVVENGKNIQEGSQDFSGVWTNSSMWETDDEKYNGLIVKKRQNAWDGIYKEIEVLSGETYTFSFFAKTDTTRGDYDTLVTVENGTAVVSGGGAYFKPVTEWKRFTLTFNCEESGTIRPRIENAYSEKGYVYICGYQLEEGSTATSYVPYGTLELEQSNEDGSETRTYQIDLQGNTLAKVGDTKDKLVIDDKGEVSIEKNINEYTFTGNENWQMNYGTGMFGINDLFDKNQGFIQGAKSISNYFIYNSVQSGIYGTLKDGEFALQKYGLSYNAFFKNLAITNVDDFKTWLSTHNTEVYYQLATPQTITLTNTKIKLFEGTNIFKLTTNLDTEFEVEYYKEVSE